MKKAIICHGVSKSLEGEIENAAKTASPARHWMAWLQWKYITAGVNCQNPSFPNSWRPVRNYEEDADIFSRLELDVDTRLVGHSCGGGFLLKYLSMHPEIKIRHLVLVAPWLDPNHELNTYFADLELDMELLSRVKKTDLFISDDDEESVRKSVQKILETYPSITVHRFKNKGHFKESDMGTKEFPELWEVCKSEI